MSPVPITVCFVEDDRNTRRVLAELLSREPALRVIGHYANGEEALRGIMDLKPDVALVDINLPGMSGIECVARLKAEMPALQVIMLTTYEESERIFDSLRAGASGYLLKKRLPQEIVPAVEQVYGGGAPMSAEVARKVIDHFRVPAQSPAPAATVSKEKASVEPVDSVLTDREREVLALLASGALYKQIADRLGISLNTVGTHVKKIYEKLHVQSRTEATLKYLGQGPRRS